MHASANRGGPAILGPLGPVARTAFLATLGVSGAAIAFDGESNWLEGALLTIVYAILAVSYFEFV